MKIITLILLSALSAFADDLIILSDGDMSTSQPTSLTVPNNYTATIEALALRGLTAELRIGGTSIPSETLTGKITVPSGTKITVYARSSEDGSLAFATIRLTELLDSVQLPTGTAVIPSTITGNVEVILESSVDLITWTPALPGMYGSSESKRFFRVRILTN